MSSRIGSFERQRHIKGLLKEHSSVSVDELAALFGVSEGTIRNDLNSLALKNALVRVRGGAVAQEAFEDGPQEDAKDDVCGRIARRAAEHVDDGEVIFLDSSPVAHRMVPFLIPRKRLTVVTNRIETARLLARDGGTSVILTGGSLRPDGSSLFGPLGLKVLQELRVAKAFLSCEAFSLESGMMDSDLLEGQLKGEVIRSATEVIAIIEARRFDAVALSHFVKTSDVHHVVTDDTVSSTVVEGLRECGVGVTICGEDSVQSLAPAGVASPRRRIAFANLSEAIPFAVEVRRGLEHAIKDRSDIDLILADNALDGETALRVAQHLLEQDIDLLIQFQIDEEANNQIMSLYQQRDVPVVAVDIPMVGAVYFGVDNFRAGYMAGTALGGRVHEQWQSRLDYAFVLEERRAGTLPGARIQGQLRGLEEALGGLGSAAQHVLNSGNTRDVARANMQSCLTTLKPGRSAVLCFNDEVALGALDAVVERGWQEHTLIVGQGADRQFRDELRRPGSPVVGATAFHPETYGDRLMELAVRLLEGKPVPPAVYVEHQFVNASNVDSIYPHD